MITSYTSFISLGSIFSFELRFNPLEIVSKKLERDTGADVSEDIFVLTSVLPMKYPTTKNIATKTTVTNTNEYVLFEFLGK